MILEKGASRVSWSKTIIVVILLLTPIFLQIIWQFTNNGLPTGDAGDHLRVTYVIYLAFADGWKQGLYILFHPVGKPVLFSAFVAPFIYFAKFNILLPVRLSLITIEALTTFAYYWLFTARIRPVVSALLGCIITTITFIFNTSTGFMPETVWHMWFVFFLAALFRSKNLTRSRLTIVAGIFLALTILARPVESIIFIIPVMGIYFYYLYLEKRIYSPSGFFFSVAASCLPITICTLCSVYNYSYVIGVTSIGLMMVLLIFQFARRNASLSECQNEISAQSGGCGPAGAMTEKFLLPFSVICSTWLLFYAIYIIRWARDSSFGAAAQTNDQVNLSENIFGILLKVFSVYGMLPIATLFLLAAVSFFSIKKITKREQIYLVFIAVALALLPMLFAYSLTGTSDMRRIFLGVVFLIIAMCFIIFLEAESSSRFSDKLFAFILVLLLCSQALSITAVVTKNNYLLSGYSYLNGSRISAENFKAPMLQKSEDAHVINEIKSLGISNAKIAVYSLGMFSSKVLFQTESLRYVTLGIDKSLNFGSLWGYTSYEPYEAVVNRLRQNRFEYVLLEGLDDPIEDPISKKQLRSHTFFVHDLLLLINKNGDNGLPNLELIIKFKIEDRFVYLFRVYDERKITATSQLDNYGPEGLFDSTEPGWHAERNPKYPQTLTIDLHEPRSVGAIGFLPQDQKPARGPKSIRIEVSDDGKSWVTAAIAGDNCVANAPDGWHDVKSAKQVKARFLKVNIFANCGDPDFLTLRGLRIAK